MPGGVNINLRPKKCSGQSRYGRYGSYATDKDRLDSITTRLDSIRTRLDRIWTRLDIIWTRLDSIRTTLDRIRIDWTALGKTGQHKDKTGLH